MREPVYYITIVSLCQDLFQNFFKFFSRYFHHSTIARHSPLGGNFNIISHLNRFVNRFLKSFLKIFRCDTFSSPRSSRQLHYSTTFSPFCQYLFLNFFHFGHSFNFDNFIPPVLCISPFRLLNLSFFTQKQGFCMMFRFKT